MEELDVLIEFVAHYPETSPGIVQTAVRESFKQVLGLSSNAVYASVQHTGSTWRVTAEMTILPGHREFYIGLLNDRRSELDRTLGQWLVSAGAEWQVVHDTYVMQGVAVLAITTTTPTPPSTTTTTPPTSTVTTTSATSTVTSTRSTTSTSSTQSTSSTTSVSTSTTVTSSATSTTSTSTRSTTSTLTGTATSSLSTHTSTATLPETTSSTWTSTSVGLEVVTTPADVPLTASTTWGSPTTRASSPVVDTSIMGTATTVSMAASLPTSPPTTSSRTFTSSTRPHARTGAPSTARPASSSTVTVTRTVTATSTRTGPSMTAVDSAHEASRSATTTSSTSTTTSTTSITTARHTVEVADPMDSETITVILVSTVLCLMLLLLAICLRLCFRKGRSALPVAKDPIWFPVDYPEPEVECRAAVPYRHEEVRPPSELRAPRYWRQAEPKGEAPVLEDVSLDVRQAMQELLDATFKKVSTRDRRGRPLPAKLRVRQVQRVENAALWQRYAKGREAIRSKRVHSCTSAGGLRTELEGGRALEDPPTNTSSCTSMQRSVNEVYLWHGTSHQSAMSISKNGFSLEHAGSATGSSLYGDGIYLAECSSKADEYARDCPEAHPEVYCLLFCRTVLGEVLRLTTGGESTYAMIKAMVASDAYDSVLGDREVSVGTYREFVVYKEEQVYPEYLVLYSREAEASSAADGAGG